MAEQLKGIDVSVHQGTIDWNKVKAAGIDFVIIRAGYGQSTVDKYFKQNIEGALKAGLKVGAYWFIYALNMNGLINNAKTFASTIEPYRNEIEMKVWCDLEYDSDNYAKKKGVTFTKATRTDMVRRFCDLMKAYGYDCGVYANPDYLKTKFEDVTMYPLWLASYSKTKPKAYNCFMWQHTSKGKVNGISGNVDMNICYGMTKEVSSGGNQTGNPYPVPTRILKKTFPVLMKGNDVKWLQYELVKKGYLPAKNKKGKSNIDGIFGNDTLTAVKAYQKAKGLVVDGKVGPKTIASLQR